MALRALMPFGRGTPLTPEQRSADPFLSFRQEMDRLFDEFFSTTGMPRLTGEETRLVPSIDVCETDSGLEVVAELPGVKEEDVDVELNGDILTIRGRKETDHEEKGRNYHILERSSGSFSRSIRLPFDVDQDKVDASFENGVLTITMPKPAEMQQRAKKISLKKSDGRQKASAGQSGGQKQKSAS